MKEDKKTKQEPIDFLKSYVKPHKKISREVTDSDIEKVVKDSHIMYNLCFTQNGPYRGGFAIAHPQIDEKDPLRFFVTAGKEIIINPTIVRHIKYLDSREEGCMSYPEEKMIEVQRWRKGEIEYQTLTEDGKLSEKMKTEVKNIDAQVYQHEIDHLNGKYIYD